MNDLGERRRDRLERSRLYLVTDIPPAGGDLEALLREALCNGVGVVQLRDKQATQAEIVRAARVFRRLCDAHDALLIVNDRPELAIACGADGVHVGQNDRTVEQARELVGDELLIGLSTHSPEQVDAVAGADYFAVGPVYATPTKPDYAPVGLELVRYAAQHASVPFFAIGGIDAGNVAAVAAAGAQRVAVVRAIRDADDPGAAARSLASALGADAAVEV